LDDSDIEEWLAQRGSYSPPAAPSPDAKPEGGIRLVISERKYFHPPSFSISKESFLKIEEHFHLPQATLHALSNGSGVFHRYMEYDESESGKLGKIGVYFFSLK
jgi:hypothetical protein